MDANGNTYTIGQRLETIQHAAEHIATWFSKQYNQHPCRYKKYILDLEVVAENWSQSLIWDYPNQGSICRRFLLPNLHCGVITISIIYLIIFYQTFENIGKMSFSCKIFCRVKYFPMQNVLLQNKQSPK